MALVEPKQERIVALGGKEYNSCYCLGAPFAHVLDLESRVYTQLIRRMDLQDPKAKERNYPKLKRYTNSQGVAYDYHSRCMVFDFKVQGESGDASHYMSFVCPDYFKGHVFITMRGLVALSKDISIRPPRERYKALLRVREWMEERIPCPNIGRVHGIYLGNLYGSSRYCPHVSEGLYYLVSQLTYLVGASGEGMLNTDILEYQLTARAAYALWSVGKLLPMDYLLYAETMWTRLNASSRHAVREERALVEPLLKAIERAKDKHINDARPFLHDGEVFGRTNASLDRMADAPLMAIV